MNKGANTDMAEESDWEIWIQPRGDYPRAEIRDNAAFGPNEAPDGARRIFSGLTEKEALGILPKVDQATIARDLWVWAHRQFSEERVWPWGARTGMKKGGLF